MIESSDVRLGRRPKALRFWRQALQRLLVILLLVGNITIPIWAGGDRSARRSLKKVVLLVIVFNLIYFVAMKYAYWRL